MTPFTCINTVPGAAVPGTCVSPVMVTSVGNLQGPRTHRRAMISHFELLEICYVVEYSSACIPTAEQTFVYLWN